LLRIAEEARAALAALAARPCDRAIADTWLAEARDRARADPAPADPALAEPLIVLGPAFCCCFFGTRTLLGASAAAPSSVLLLLGGCSGKSQGDLLDFFPAAPWFSSFCFARTLEW